MRWFLLLAVGSVFLVLPTTGSSATRTPNATAAARACSGGRPLSAKLGAGDAAFQRLYTACVIRQERAQLGVGYNQSPRVSARLHAALSRFFASGLRLKPHGVHLADRAVLKAVRVIVSKTCPRGATFVEEYGDTSPPPLTPIVIARAVAQKFGGRYGHIVMRAPGATFGVASRRGLVFENHNSHGSMSIWIGVVCN